MKSTLMILMVLFFVAACNSGQIKQRTDLEMSNMTGKVWKVEKKINDAHASCLCPASTRDECDQSLTVYDEKGNIKEIFNIDPNGDTALHLIYVYKGDGEFGGIDKYANAKLSGREVPVIRNGRLVGLNILNDDGDRQTSYTYKYGGDNLAKVETRNAEGDLINRWEYEYLDGKMVSQTEIGKDGKVRSTTKFKRNDKNDVWESLISIAGDTAIHKVTYEYEYDDMGNWIKQTKIYKNEISNVILRNISYYNSPEPL